MSIVKRIGLVALILVFGIIAACSGKAEKPIANSSEPTQSVKESASQQPEVEGEKEPYEFSIMLSNETSDYARELKPDDVYTTELTKLSGVKVNYNFFEAQDINNILTTRLASKEMPNVFQLSRTGITDPTVKSAVNAGVFLDLTELLQKHGQNLLKAFPEEVWKSPQISKDGKIYGIPKKAAAGTTRILVIRQDYLDRLGMKTPETLDDYLAYFEGVKNTDMNGNGKQDEIPLALTSELSQYNWAFEGYFNVFPGVFRWNNGEAVPDIIQPQMKELIAFMRTLYEKGYINEDMFTATLGDRQGRIQVEPIGSYLHDVTNVGSTAAGVPSWYSDPGATGGDAVIDVVNGPTTPEGTKRFSLLGPGFSRVYVIDAKTENPEEIIKYYDWMMSGKPEVVRFFTSGVEGYNYTMDNGKVVFDPTAEVNAAIGFVQFMLGIQDWRVSDEVIAFDPQAERVKRGKDLAMEAAVDTGMFKFMSLSDLPAFQTNPQLGSDANSLYGKMFANVVLGREPVDAAFDKFVSDWKKQGGDQLIQEAKQWHLDNAK